MVGTIILIVVGLLLAGVSIPLFSFLGLTVVGAFAGVEYAPLGAIAGWILGVVGVGVGLVIAIVNVISLVQQLTS